MAIRFSSPAVVRHGRWGVASITVIQFVFGVDLQVKVLFVLHFRCVLAFYKGECTKHTDCEITRLSW